MWKYTSALVRTSWFESKWDFSRTRKAQENVKSNLRTNGRNFDWKAKYWRIKIAKHWL